MIPITSENSDNQPYKLGEKQPEIQQRQLSVLIVGRILEEDQTFRITKMAVKKFNQQVKTKFYFMDKKTVEKVRLLFKEQCQCCIFNARQDCNIINYVITIGGDGTILYAAKEFTQEKETPPFLVFQKGTLGFMCQFSVSNMQSVIERAVKLIKKSWSPSQIIEQPILFNIKRNMRLGILFTARGNETPNFKKVCVNELAITRQKSQRIILRIYLNKQLLTQTSGYGILISTPTGSTAYALSAGGPVIANGVNCISIVPIAPHSLSFRPICVPSSSEISIQIAQKSKSNATMSFDGQFNYPLQEGDWITIKQSQSDLILFQPLDDEQKNLPDWMQRLQQFLGWNQGFKSPKCQQLQKRLQKIQQRTQSMSESWSQFGKHRKESSSQQNIEAKKIAYKSNIIDPDQ